MEVDEISRESTHRSPTPQSLDLVVQVNLYLARGVARRAKEMGNQLPGSRDKVSKQGQCQTVASAQVDYCVDRV